MIKLCTKLLFAIVNIIIIKGVGEILTYLWILKLNKNKETYLLQNLYIYVSYLESYNINIITRINDQNLPKRPEYVKVSNVENSFCPFLLFFLWPN